MKVSEELSHFIKGQMMGIEIMKLCLAKARDKEVKAEIENTISEYKDRLYQMTDLYFKKINKQQFEMTFFQKRAIGMVKCELKMIKDDSKLAKYVAKIIAMGTVGALKYYQKVTESPTEAITIYQETIRDYIATYDKFCNLVLSL